MSVPTEGLAPTAYLYLRVSTKEQATKGGESEGFSIPAQRDACKRKAMDLGAVVTEIYIDAGESARSADRTDLKRMLTDLRDKAAPTYVIVHKVDRLARNRADDVEINLAIQAAGARLVSATENIDETPSGMLLHGIMSTIAEFYSRNLATEVVKGMDQKARTGGTPGKAPLGYRNVMVTTPEGRLARTVEIDTERAEHIVWAFEAYAKGDWSIKALCAELNARGLTQAPTPKYPARPIQESHLHHILSHPYYKGKIVFRGVTYKGKHPALIDEVTWDRVQAVLATRRNGEKTRNHPHYLKSTIYCGTCGSRYVVTKAKNRHGAVYPYFVCLGRHQKRTSCTRKAILIPTVEALVEDFYASVAIDQDLSETLKGFISGELKASLDSARRLERGLTVQRQRLMNERSKLLQAHYAGAIPLDLLKTEQDRIAEQLKAIDERINATEASYEELAGLLDQCLQLARDCHQGYLNAPPSVRRMFNHAFFDKLYIDEDGVRAEFAEPFATLLGVNAIALAKNAQPKPDLDLPEQEVGVSETWDRALLRLVRDPGSFESVPEPVLQDREGLKEKVLVPPAGFEPATYRLGGGCSIP